MQEIVATEAMKAEILEDARKKAEHILKEAGEEAEREAAAAEELAAKAADDIARESSARIGRKRAEADSRLPLDKLRARTGFVDRALREATRDLIGSLPEAEIARIASSMIGLGAPLIAGRRALVRRRGLPASAADAAAALLGAGARADPEEDESLPAPGLAAFAEDGGASLRATMDLVEERLLDSKRAELARALCAEALGLALGLGSDAAGGGAADPGPGGTRK